MSFVHDDLQLPARSTLASASFIPTLLTATSVFIIAFIAAPPVDMFGFFMCGAFTDFSIGYVLVLMARLLARALVGGSAIGFLVASLLSLG